MNISELVNSFVNILNEMSPYILLGFLIAGVLHVFVNEKTLTRHLSGKGWKPVLKAAAIGVPLPLCSCGVLPTAVSLRRQGASKGATTSFLIATPQTGVDSIAATYSLLGLAFAIIRPVAALVGAVFGGMCVNAVDSKDGSTEDSADNCSKSCCTGKMSAAENTFLSKLTESVRYGFVDMIDNMGKWLIIGLIVATLITVFVPDSFFVGFREYPLVAMIIVVLIAIPMYICATGSIPIAMSLMLKGMTPGVAFVLLMAGPAANFASILILNRTLGKRSTIVYVASVVATAIVFGLIIDYLLPAQWFTFTATAVDHCAHAHLGWFETTCSGVLVTLLLFSTFKLMLLKRKSKNIEVKTPTVMTKTFKISGMKCMHCRASAEKAISEVAGVESVTVDLASGEATVNGDFDPKNVVDAIRLAGFDVE